MPPRGRPINRSIIVSPRSIAPNRMARGRGPMQVPRQRAGDAKRGTFRPARPTPARPRADRPTVIQQRLLRKQQLNGVRCRDSEKRRSIRHGTLLVLTMAYFRTRQPPVLFLSTKHLMDTPRRPAFGRVFFSSPVGNASWPRPCPVYPIACDPAAPCNADWRAEGVMGAVDCRRPNSGRRDCSPEPARRLAVAGVQGFRDTPRRQPEGAAPSNHSRDLCQSIPPASDSGSYFPSPFW